MSLPNSLKTPGLLQKIQWVVDPVGYMENAAKQYPDIFTANVVGFGSNLVFVNQPQAIQTILTNDRKQFAALGELNRILSPLIGDYSIVLLEGNQHRRRRQLLMPPFHGERMRAYGELICRLTQQVFDQVVEGQVFRARDAAQQISLQVILEAVFGLKAGEQMTQLRQLMASMSELFRSPITSSMLFFNILQQDLGAKSPWGRFVREREAVDRIIYSEIAERRKSGVGDRADILSLLMTAQDETGEFMTDQELRDELMTLLFAGHETTATAMSWALYWSHHIPQVRERILQELASLGPSPDPVNITKLPYLTAVCNETLRIHPVAMLTFPRVVQEPVELLGHKLEPGTPLMGCMYLVHQREDLYPQPKQFKPERFLERQFSPYEFIPFGGGVRRCIGEALAMFELKLVLGTVLSRYELELADTKPEIPCRRGVTLAPKNGVKMRLVRKQAPLEMPVAVEVR